MLFKLKDFSKEKTKESVGPFLNIKSNPVMNDTETAKDFNASFTSACIRSTTK